MDIGPGDWVECVDASPAGKWPTSPLVTGGIYSVRSIHCFGENITLNEVEPPGFFLVFAADRFRPIYRPKESLIRSLLEPVDEVVSV